MSEQLMNDQGQYIGRATALGRALVQTLSAQRDLYIQLAELARRQTDLVTAGRSEELMTVLAARSRLIDQLAPLDAQLQPFKSKWQTVLDSLGAEDRSAVSTLLTQVQQLLSDLLEQDEADRQALIRQKTDVGTQIGRTVTGTQLNRAYGSRPRTVHPGYRG